MKEGLRTIFNKIYSLVNLKFLDGIEDDKVSNSAAFKLGALAGILPALSLMALGSTSAFKNVIPDVAGIGWAVIASSALTGGTVAFFLAGNRLKEIFSYGVAAPAVVIALYGSSIAGINAGHVTSLAEKRVQRAESARVESEKAVDAARSMVPDSPQTATASSESAESGNPDVASP